MNNTTPQVFTQISETATRAPAEQTATWTPPCSIIARMGGRRQRGFTTAISASRSTRSTRLMRVMVPMVTAQPRALMGDDWPIAQS